MLRKMSTGGAVLLEAELVERANLKLGIGAVDELDIADLLGEFERLAQVSHRFEHHGLAIVERLVHLWSPPLSALWPPL